VPVIADGGIKYSGDISKAIAAGAAVAMLGGLFAGRRNHPAKRSLPGAHIQVVPRHGLARRDAAGSADRYAQEGAPRGKSVPEGVEGRVPYKGSLAALTDQLVGGAQERHGFTVAWLRLPSCQERSRSCGSRSPVYVKATYTM